MKLDGGRTLTLDIWDDIIERMSKDEKIELGNVVCMDPEVLDYLVQEIARGYAGRYVDSHILDARLKLIDKMPEASVEVIRSLLHEVEMAKAEAEHYREWAYRMWDWFPRQVCCQKRGCDTTYTFRVPEKNPYPVTRTPTADEIMKKCGFVPEKVNTDSEEL